MTAARVLADLRWRIECRLNRRIGGEAETPYRFASQGGIDLLTGEHPAVPRPALCITLITHARPEFCRSLVESLRASLEQAGLLAQSFLLILEDPSKSDYAPVLSYLKDSFPGRFAFYRAENWCGKKARHRVFQTAFSALRQLEPARVLFIEDDVAIEPDFVARALELWESIDDPRKAVLYLACFDDDEQNGRWIRFRRRDLPGGRLRLTQWFDFSAFFVERSFLETFRYEVFRTPPTRWDEDPRLSCGMPEQFTRRIRHRGNVYQVTRTLAFHGAAPSLLNPEARDGRVMDNRSPPSPIE